MSERFTITAEKREKKKVKKVREAGFVPALLYNHGQTDEIQVNSADLSRLFDHGVTEATLIDIKIGKKENQTAFIKSYQIHPVTESILHVDFFRITFGEKVRTHIPIEFTGKPIGVKEGGVLEAFLHDVEIEIFPKYLTSALEVDISHLKIGDSIHMEDVEIPPESKILMDGNPIVCQISTSAKLESKIEDIGPAAVEEEKESDEGQETEEN